jgi:hypothetical protein
MKKQITTLAPKMALARFGSVMLPQFANVVDRSGPILGADPGGGYRDGQVFFANDARFLETYYSEPLTQYIQGWRDPNNIEETLQFCAPAVPVGRRFEWKSAENSEEFLSEVVDDERAIGADFKAVKYTAKDVTDKTYNRGLTMIVDLDNVPGAGIAAVGGQIPPWQQQRTAKLTRRLYRNSFRRALAAIDAAAVKVPYVWAAQPINPNIVPVNPDLDVQTELKAGTDVTGIRGNRVAYGDSAFLYRNQAYGAQNNPAGYLGYSPNVEASLAAALQVDQVMISRERYQLNGAAKAEILGAAVYSFFAMDGVDTEDPSNIKRFVSEFDSEQGGGLLRVYVQQISSKLVAITVEFYEKIVITYAGGIRKMVITQQ